MQPVMQHVKSSNVHSVGHDGIDSLVTFKNKKTGEPVSTYRYHDVPAEKHADLVAADSPNTHLNAHIKPHHKYTKLKDILTPPEAAA